MVEESVVVIKARNFDEEIQKGEKESKDYASFKTILIHMDKRLFKNI